MALARTSLVASEKLSELSISLIIPCSFFAIQALMILAAATASEKSTCNQHLRKITQKYLTCSRYPPQLKKEIAFGSVRVFFSHELHQGRTVEVSGPQRRAESPGGEYGLVIKKGVITVKPWHGAHSKIFRNRRSSHYTGT